MEDKDHFVQQLPAEKQTLFKTFLKNPTEITGLTHERKVGVISVEFFAFRNQNYWMRNLVTQSVQLVSVQGVRYDRE